MPFKSEKQRRYMHANLPELAKRWERDYANGGIASQGGMKNYLGEQPMINAPKYWQSAPDHEMTELAYITPKERDVLVNMNMYGTMDGSPNEGPSGIMSLNGWGDASQGFGTSGGGTGGTGGHSYGDKERYKSVDVQGPPNIHGGTTRTIGPTTPKDTFKQSWSGQPRFLGFGGGYRNLKTPGVTPEHGGAYQSRFGLGSLLRGAMSMFGGIPGKIGSMLSHINPGKLRGWNEQYGRYNTQDEYEQARTNRRNTKRMDYLSDRKSRGLGYGKKAYGDLLGQGYSDPFQEALNRDLQINPETTQFSRSHLQSLANKQALTNQLSAKDFINLDPSNMRMMEVANNPALSRYKKTQGIASINNQWSKPQFQQAGYIPKYAKPSGQYSDSIAKLGHKKAIEEGVGPKEFETWLKGDGSMLKESHPDYANTLLNELQISDWDKTYPSENLDVKGRNTEAKQRSALNTLMGEVNAAKARGGNDIGIRSDLMKDYIQNEEKYDDLGITTQEQYEDFINKAMRLKGYI